jgi:hypothetical protein
MKTALALPLSASQFPYEMHKYRVHTAGGAIFLFPSADLPLTLYGGQFTPPYALPAPNPLVQGDSSVFPSGSSVTD